MIGYVQVYTGNGKGKTTAACGLAMRAVGAGLKVFFAQFLKTGNSHELTIFRHFEDYITVRQFGYEFRLMNDPSDEDAIHTQQGIDTVRTIMETGTYDVIILDEVNVAVQLGMIKIEEIIGLIDRKPGHVELVFTGRYAHPDLIARADLVTEMNAIKHYYPSENHARKGIEY